MKWFASATFLTATLLGLQPAASQQITITLNQFFKQLLATSDHGSLPTALESARVFDQIPSSSPRAITEALPDIDRALRHDNPDIRKYAIVALICIDQRSDSADLLLPVVPSLLRRLDDPDPQITAQAVSAIGSMKPKPPSYIIPVFVQFLSTKNAKTLAGPAVVFALVRLASDQAAVGQAIARFMQENDLNVELRVDTLNALALRSMHNDQIIQQIIQKLAPSESLEVRLAAINALESIGPHAVQMGREQLAEVAQNNEESPQVRNAAKHALQSPQE